MQRIFKRSGVIDGGVYIRGAPLNRKAEDNVMTFVLVSRDNGGKRYDWQRGEYYTEVLDPNGADYSRTLSFFKDHNADVDSAIGAVENIRVEADELLGDVRFGTDKQSQSIMRKYEEGLLSGVSVRYTQDEYKDEETDGARTRTVTKYKLYELSAVGIPFDQGATKRGVDMTKEELEKLNKEKQEKQRKLDEATDNLQATEQRAKEAEEQIRELTRVNDINTLAREINADDEFVAKYRDNKDLDANALARDYAKSLADKSINLRTGNTEVPDDIKKQAEDALFSRMGGQIKGDNIFVGATIRDIAGELTGANRQEALERGITTSMLPNALGGAGKRLLAQEFDKASTTFQQWTEAKDRPDFRIFEDITAGAGGILDKMTEGGELKSKSIYEGATQGKVDNYGNKYVVTFEAMVNDDLGIFAGLLSEFGISSALTAEVRTYQMLTRTGAYSNFVMGDGLPIFHANHFNKLDLALDSAGLSEAKLTMRRQKLPSGDNAYIVPKYLIVPPELEDTAKILVRSTSLATSGNSGEINVHQNEFTVIVAPHLQPTEWYITTDRRTLVANYLAGTGRKPIIQLDRSSITEIVYKGMFQVGISVSDYRGMVKGK